VSWIPRPRHSDMDVYRGSVEATRGIVVDARDGKPHQTVPGCRG
jgi:hypothetical protein